MCRTLPDLVLGMRQDLRSQSTSVQVASSGQLYIDVDANGTIDSVIKLTGVTTLTSAAFLIDAT